MLDRCCISQKTHCITVTKADIADIFSEIIFFFILRAITLVTVSSIFKKFPEFASLIDRN